MDKSLLRDHDGTGGAPGDLGAFNRGVGMGGGYPGDGTQNYWLWAEK